MSVLTLESSALVLDLTQLCCCITQTHHRCPSAGLCESSQDDAYRKEKPAWWCLLLAATSLRWTTKSLCSLTCHLYREDSFACLSKTTVKSGFMLYAKVNFFPTSMFMKANKQSNIHPGSNPLILSHSPDVRGTTTRQVLLCPQGHVCHCAREGTKEKGAETQGCSCVDGTCFPCTCGLEETVWLCTYPLHRLPIFGLFPFTWGLVMPGLRCCNVDGVILPCLW